MVWRCGGDESAPAAAAAYTGRMEWAADTDPSYAGKITTLGRRERPQLLLSGAGAAGSSYGQPRVLFTSAEDCSFKGAVDGGFGEPCATSHGTNPVGTTKSYTVLQSIAI